MRLVHIKTVQKKIREYHWNWSGEQVINQKLLEAKERINANKKLQKQLLELAYQNQIDMKKAYRLAGIPYSSYHRNFKNRSRS